MSTREEIWTAAYLRGLRLAESLSVQQLVAGCAQQADAAVHEYEKRWQSKETTPLPDQDAGEAFRQQRAAVLQSWGKQAHP